MSNLGRDTRYVVQYNVPYMIFQTLGTGDNLVNTQRVVENIPEIPKHVQ
jgi:hypothetical protein